jgi:hypothetical protein
VVAEGVDALAYAAQARLPGASAPAADGLTYLLPKQPEHLSADDVLIAVVDGKSIAVRTVKRPRRRRGARTPDALARDAARHLAEIGIVVDDMLAGADAGVAGADVLTADEERVLTAGGFDTAPLRADEDEALLRAALEYARLLSSSLTVERAAAVLGVNPSRIRQRLTRKPRSLYGIKDGKSWRIPKFQFAGKKLVPGIGAVFEALSPALHPVAVHRWLTTPHPDLHVDSQEERPVAPLDWLRTGRSPQAVAELASGI